MEEKINIEFKVNDVVWHKNLVTNEAMKTKIKWYKGVVCSDGSKCVIYHTEDGTIAVNIEGRPNNTNIFATKEECDSYPPYNPYQYNNNDEK